MDSNVKGIGMISGGLDSLLAVALLKEQRIELSGVHFLNGFGPGTLKRRVYEGLTLERLAEERSALLGGALGIPVDVIDLSEEFLGLLENPDHGFGKNINPCVDCRIFFLKRAKEKMEREGASFVFTGEVLGQRPMSQHMQAMRLVERDSGLQGRLLRPLCARLLPPTLVESEGLVDREKLLDIQGRSRKRQFQLARELGLTEYQQPAGGCSLTDMNYARRFRDFITHGGGAGIGYEDAVLLSTGRHLRLSPSVKMVVGRNENENNYIERNWSGGCLLSPVDRPGPTALLQGDFTAEELATAAAVVVRYSDAGDRPSARIAIRVAGKEEILDTVPAGEIDTESRMI